MLVKILCYVYYVNYNDCTIFTFGEIMYFPDNYSGIFYAIKTFAIITFNNSFFMVNKRSINIKIYFVSIQCKFSKNENK